MRDSVPSTRLIESTDSTILVEVAIIILLLTGTNFSDFAMTCCINSKCAINFNIIILVGTIFREIGQFTNFTKLIKYTQTIVTGMQLCCTQ